MLTPAPSGASQATGMASPEAAGQQADATIQDARREEAGAATPKPVPERALAAAKRWVRRPSWAKPYASGRSRALWLKIFLIAGALAGTALAVSTFLSIRLVREAMAGHPVPQAASEFIRLLMQAAGVLTSVSSLTAFVLLLVWLHRAYRNLHALGARQLSDSPGWAVGSFFIPLLNWYLPYRIVADIWIESDPRPSAPEQAGRRRARRALFVLIWWGAWLAANIIGSATGLMIGHLKTPQAFLDVAGYLILIRLLFAVAFLLTFFVVTIIQNRQDRKWELVSAASAGAPEPTAPASPATP